MKPHTLLHRQAGFTFVELLVTMVIALFATLIIAQTFALAEGYRRTGTSGGDATFSGAVGTYVINHDLIAAGYGINTAAYFGCDVTLSDQNPPSGAVPRLADFTLAPVRIDFGAAATTPDAVWVVSSGNGTAPGPINLAAPMTAATDNYTVTSAFGVTAGDVLVLAQAGGAGCTLVEASNTPTKATSNQNVIQHASTGASSRYNPTGGWGPAYPASAIALDLGAAPTVNRYYVLNNTLVVDQVVAGQIAQPVAPNIVQLKAMYGVDTVGDGAVHAWSTTPPATASAWATILAVRVALVAQSANPDKPSNLPAGTCTTTTALPTVTWEDGTTTTLDVSATGAANGISWTCFRYKTFHVTSSLRNIIWTPS